MTRELLASIAPLAGRPAATTPLSLSMTAWPATGPRSPPPQADQAAQTVLWANGQTTQNRRASPVPPGSTRETRRALPFQFASIAHPDSLRLTRQRRTITRAVLAPRASFNPTVIPRALIAEFVPRVGIRVRRSRQALVMHVLTRRLAGQTRPPGPLVCAHNVRAKLGQAR